MAVYMRADASGLDQVNSYLGNTGIGQAFRVGIWQVQLAETPGGGFRVIALQALFAPDIDFFCAVLSPPPLLKLVRAHAISRTPQSRTWDDGSLRAVGILRHSAD